MIFKSGGVNRKSMVAPANGALEFHGGFLHEAGSRLGGDGLLQFGAGTNRIDGGFTPAGQVEVGTGSLEVTSTFTNTGMTFIRSGRLIVRAPVFLSDLNLQSGTLQSDQTLTLTGRGIWGGGELEGDGIILVGTAAELAFTNFTAKTLSTRLHAAGLVVLSEIRNLTFSEGTLRVQPTGELRVVGTNTLFRTGGTNSVLRNEGLIRFEAGNPRLELNSALRFEQAGRLDIPSGSLSVADSMWSGVSDIGPGAAMILEPGPHTILAGASFDGTGAVRLRNSGRLILTAPVDLGGLQVTFDPDARVTGRFLLSNTAAGHWIFSARNTVEGAVAVGGIVEVPPSQILTINDTLTLRAGGEIRTDGTVRAVSFDNQGGTVGPNPVEESGGVAPVILSIATIARTPIGTTAGVHGPPGIRVTWSARMGGRHVVEASTDLQSWSPVATGVATVDGVGRLQADIAVNTGSRFLRIRVDP